MPRLSRAHPVGDAGGAPPRAADLLGTALALELEAVRRYTQLAEAMDRRGAADTAATFRSLVEEERGHAGAIRAWAAHLGVDGPDATGQAGRLPPDIAQAWESLLGRARITPYEALAVAVRNEEQAFAFYTYVAAHAEAPAVRAMAERLAAEELGHAALLRRARRTAYHREGRTPSPPPGRGLTLAGLAARQAAFTDDDALADWLDAVARTAEDEAVMLAAQEALARVVERLAART